MKLLNANQIKEYSDKRMSKINQAMDKDVPKSFLSHNIHTLHQVHQKYKSNEPVVFVNEDSKDQREYINNEPFINKKFVWASMKNQAQKDPSLKTFDDDLKSGFITKPIEILDNRFLASNSPYNHIYKAMPKTDFDHLNEFGEMNRDRPNHHPDAVADGQYLKNHPKVAKELGLKSTKHNVVEDAKTGSVMTALDNWKRYNSKRIDLVYDHPEKAISRSDIMRKRMIPENADVINQESPNEALSYITSSISGQHDPISNALRHNLKQDGITRTKANHFVMNIGNGSAVPISKELVNDITRYTRNDLNSKAVDHSDIANAKYVEYTIPHVSMNRKSNEIMSGAKLHDKARDISRHFGKKVAKNFKSDPVLSHANIARSFDEDHQQLHYAFNMAQHYNKKSDSARKPKQKSKYYKLMSKYSRGFDDLAEKFNYHYISHITESNPHFKMLKSRFNNSRNNKRIVDAPAKFGAVDFSVDSEEDHEFADGEGKAIYNQVTLPNRFNRIDKMAKEDPVGACNAFDKSFAKDAKSPNKEIRLESHDIRDMRQQSKKEFPGLYEPSQIYKTNSYLRSTYNIPIASNVAKPKPANKIRQITQHMDKHVASGISKNSDFSKPVGKGRAPSNDSVHKSTHKSRSNTQDKKIKLAKIKRSRERHL